MGTLIAGVAIGILLGVGGYFLLRTILRRGLLASLSLELFLVKIPQSSPRAEGTPEQALKNEIGKFEQLLANLTPLKSSFVFEAAVPHVGEEIHFYLAVPRLHRETAAKQVQGLWGSAVVEPVYGDYNIFNEHGVSAAAYVTQKEKYAFPIRTYAEIGADTFSSIAGGFTKINVVGEGAALQVIVRPADEKYKKEIRGYITLLKRGEKPEEVLHKKFPVDFGTIQKTLAPRGKEDKGQRKEESVVDEELIKALEMKIVKPLYEVNVRIAASAPSPFQAKDIVDGIAAGFGQFGAPRRNEFRVVSPRNQKTLITSYIYRQWNGKEKIVLSSEEIASIFHFPTASLETPKVKWLKAKEAPPPTLPRGGVRIGMSSFRGESRPVFLTEDDRRRHLYLVGQTGTGKSTLLGNMLLQDIEEGRGLALIDPHGDFAENALGFVPQSRIDDVIYFSPGDLLRPLGLNMLDYNPSRPEEKTFIVNEMQSIFNRLFTPETMGPMFEQYMRNALLLLMEDMPNEPATLVEVPRVFTDAEYRKRKLARIVNPVVIDFWEKEAAKAGGEASLANMTPYITSKFNNFIANDYMRPVIGQTRSAFNFREVLDQGKILLVNLSKGRIGDINANLLGMIFSGKLLMAALSRVDVSQESRRDFNLYIDEFHNFTTDSIATILSEARKYRLHLTIAHQFIAQLTENIRDAVFGNVGSMIVFRVGVQDAEFLVKQFEPTFDQNDLVNIDNLNAYAKILIHGETSRPFNIKIETTSWNRGNREFAEKLKEYSRLKYGMDRSDVEAEIVRRLRE